MKSRKLLLPAILAFCVIFIGAALVYAAQGPPPGDRDFLSEWDKDGDEKVSRMELPVPNSHFNRLDQNKDGFIDKDEAPQGPPQGHKKHRRGGPGKHGFGHGGPGSKGPAPEGTQGPPPGDRDFIGEWDKDGDGKVSRMELPVPNSRFDRLDQNSDGLIDKDEAPQGPPPGHAKRGHGGPGKHGFGHDGPDSKEPGPDKSSIN